MKKKHTYVTCQSCEGRIINYPDFDWVANPCRHCHNTRQVVDPKEILCNMCGETMCPIGTHNEQYPHGLYKAKVSGGYDSYHLFDTTNYIFSFCEKCLRQMFIQCKIKPDVQDYCFGPSLEEPAEEGESIEWDHDLKAYEYRVWRDEGGHHQAYLNHKCNVKKDCPNKAVYTILNNDEKFSEDCSCEEHKKLGTYSNSSLVRFISPILRPLL